MTAIVKMHARLLRKLRDNSSGVALIEFAYGLPLLLAIGFGGMEIANLAITRMRISQLAMAIADNASRLGETPSGSAQKMMREGHINDIFIGAKLQGASIQFKERGRVIISSLQQNVSGGQWIAWQRCWGDKTYASTVGVAGTGRTGTAFPGMGTGANLVTAPATTPVIFVEVAYDYRAIVEPFAKELQYFGLRVDNQTLTYRAAFMVRDPRRQGVSNSPNAAVPVEDLGIYQSTPAVVPSVCT